MGENGLMGTIAPSVENRLAERHHELPVWIRAPKSGHEFYTGLKRGKLYELAGRGLIRAFCLREGASQFLEGSSRRL